MPITTRNVGSTRTGIPAIRNCAPLAITPGYRSSSDRDRQAGPLGEQTGSVGSVRDLERLDTARGWVRRGRPVVTIDADHLPEGDDKVAAVRTMFDAIAPRYDLVNRVMTFRMDVGWRRRTVNRLALAPGSTVLDVACGTGDLCGELARQGLSPIGADLSFGMLAAGHSGVPLVQADALVLPVSDASIDGVTCGFALRNLVALVPFFGELARVVRPGGRIALLEVAVPANSVMRWGHGVYFGKVVPRIGGLLSDPAAYRYLPKSVAYLPEPPELLDQLRRAGFADAARDQLSGGIAQLLTATRDRSPSAGVPQ
jgi:demethylmenaquinone methyltransferase / 2-methoxy-6-polyprenyl-1,4-benzoquinol methylase